MADQKAQYTEVRVTAVGRCTRPALAEPSRWQDKADSPLRYSTGMYLDEAGAESIRAVCREAVALAWPNGVPAGIAMGNPLKTVPEDKRPDPSLPYRVFIGTGERYPPGTFGPDKQGEVPDAIDPSEIFAGDWIRLAFRARASEQDVSGVKVGRVTLYLNDVQLVRSVPVGQRFRENNGGAGRAAFASASASAPAGAAPAGAAPKPATTSTSDLFSGGAADDSEIPF